MEKVFGDNVTITYVNGVFTVQEGVTTYTIEWVGTMLKVYGGDVCYYLVEGVAGLMQLQCSMDTMTLLMPN